MWTSATGSLDAFAAEKKVLAWLQNNAPAPFTTCHAKNFRCLCCAFSPVLPLCCVQSYRQRVRELANFFNVHCLQGVHIALSTTELLPRLSASCFAALPAARSRIRRRRSSAKLRTARN